MGLYLSIGLVVVALVIGLVFWLRGVVINVTDSYTPSTDRKIIAKGGSVEHVPTRNAKEQEDCQHVQDFEKWTAFYRGESLPFDGSRDSAIKNKRAEVEGRIAAGRHIDDWGGDS